MEENNNTNMPENNSEIEFQEKLPFLDKVRKLWEKYVFQSNIGNWCIKILLGLIVFISIETALSFGLSKPGSLISDVFNKVGEFTDNVSLAVLVLELAIPVIFIFTPAFGTFFSALVLYASYASISPVVLLFAFVLMLMFQLEDMSILAMLIAMPVVIFSKQLNVGLLFAALAAFVSNRKNNGLVKSMGFVYAVLLELANGHFGMAFNASGDRLIPAKYPDGRVAMQLKIIYENLAKGKAADQVPEKLFILLLIYFVVGFIFSKLLKFRYSREKTKIDAEDGILFGILFVLICIAGYLVPMYTAQIDYKCNYLMVAIQIIAVYILTRPISGKSPYRGIRAVSEDRNYIFISYAHADTKRVMPYLKIMKKYGYEFWYDDSIDPGTEWQAVIASNLANCMCFMAFVSEYSIESKFCNKEINYAASKNKPIAAVMLDNPTLPPELEMIFASVQAVERNKYKTDLDCMKKVFEMKELKDCCYNSEEEEETNKEGPASV